MEEFLMYVFDHSKDEVLKDFSKDELDEISSGYKNYLRFHYEDTINEEDLDKAKIIFTKVEINNFKGVSKQKKQSLFLRDLALEELKYFSDYSRIYADERRINDRIVITEKQANNFIEQVEELANHVKEFNKGIASKILSESIADFMYASGMSDNMSFRTARKK